ncbi:MAG: hypothetical protein ACFE96_11700 [Candidatus Hermodarchaeota archaeon]
MNLEEDADNKKKIEVLSKIDELRVLANNHYLMGKYDEAIKVTEKIMDIAERAKLYSVVREEGEQIANFYKQAKKKNVVLARDDIEGLKEEYENLLAENKITEAHELLQSFEKHYEKKMSPSSIKRVKDLLQAEEERWSEHHKDQLKLIKQLEPLEIQFNSYINTNNLPLAEETLEKARKLLKTLKDAKILKVWETVETTFLKLKKKYDLDENIKKNLDEVSRFTENYEFGKAKEILVSNIELLRKSNLTNYVQKLEAKLKYVTDAESKYVKLEEDIKELERNININVSQNQFRDAIEKINQIIKISRFIGKTNYLENYAKYIDILEKKIKKTAEIEDKSYIIKKLNMQGLESLKNEDYIVALEIYRKIVDLITNLK